MTHGSVSVTSTRPRRGPQTSRLRRASRYAPATCLNALTVELADHESDSALVVFEVRLLPVVLSLVEDALSGLPRLRKEGEWASTRLILALCSMRVGCSCMCVVAS